ncbi:hypothetical protein K491DRAFT_675505 [Lophiostoma macrostomum CBS 122681]|uniref:Uncharacterized protein n=1 Tax=Lophiostoma macrostomum CBS 122681 TaxID=1314788 RepID=A0A6A6TIG5_9PLEO|nr:hypothetical protein K491DRAFT_675505 [Lophiostoma macrostomum CBS 122681]
MSQSSEPFHLLRLPGELRNAVCRFALSTNDGLYHCKDAFGKRILCASPSGFLDFNQLKYASRQLYQETAGLELHCNTLIFPDRPLRTGPSVGLKNFLSFQHGMTPYWRGMIRTVIIQHNFDCPVGVNKTCICYQVQMSDLIKFSTTHQKATVYFEVKLDARDGIHFIGKASMVYEALRGSEVPGLCYYSNLLCRFAEVADWASIPEKIRRSYGTSRHLPCNIILLPHGQLDEESFRECILRWSISQPNDPNKGSFEEVGGVEACVSLARKWYAEGI